MTAIRGGESVLATTDSAGGAWFQWGLPLSARARNASISGRISVFSYSSGGPRSLVAVFVHGGAIFMWTIRRCRHDANPGRERPRPSWGRRKSGKLRAERGEARGGRMRSPRFAGIV